MYAILIDQLAGFPPDEQRPFDGILHNGQKAEDQSAMM